jgi:hypothetical protein
MMGPPTADGASPHAGLITQVMPRRAAPAALTTVLGCC